MSGGGGSQAQGGGWSQGTSTSTPNLYSWRDILPPWVQAGQQTALPQLMERAATGLPGSMPLVANCLAMFFPASILESSIVPLAWPHKSLSSWGAIPVAARSINWGKAVCCPACTQGGKMSLQEYRLGVD